MIINRIIFIYYVLLKRVQPYTQQRAINVELFLICTYMVTMYFVIYIKDNLSDVLQIFGVIIIIVINIMLVLILLNEFIKANWEKIMRYSSILLKYIGSKRKR